MTAPAFLLLPFLWATARAESTAECMEACRTKAAGDRNAYRECALSCRSSADTPTGGAAPEEPRSTRGTGAAKVHWHVNPSPTPCGRNSSSP